MHNMKSSFLGQVVLIGAALVTESMLIRLIYINLQYRSIDFIDISMCLWTLVPYISMGWFLYRHSEFEQECNKAIVLSSTVGVYIIFHMIYRISDPFGLIWLPFVPIIQLIIFRLSISIFRHL